MVDGVVGGALLFCGGWRCFLAEGKVSIMRDDIKIIREDSVEKLAFHFTGGTVKHGVML